MNCLLTLFSIFLNGMNCVEIFNSCATADNAREISYPVSVEIKFIMITCRTFSCQFALNIQYHNCHGTS